MIARKMHRTLEPYHGMIYFVPEATAEYAALGLDDFSRSYFAARAAALGPVAGEVVVATFYNFEPSLVARAIPSAWEVASPAAWSAARRRAADAALRRLIPDQIASREVIDAAALARRAALACPPAGRPLFAAHLALDWPDEPHLALWHGLTLLREHRGDGHIACLVREGVGPCEALVLHERSGMIPPGFLQPTRAWSDEQWQAAEEGLRRRGWLAGAGLTEAGEAVRERIEHDSDRTALPPWEHLGEEGAATLRGLVRPLSRAISARVDPVPKV
jgi:hypothetical protein